MPRPMGEFIFVHIRHYRLFRQSNVVDKGGIMEKKLLIAGLWIAMVMPIVADAQCPGPMEVTTDAHAYATHRSEEKATQHSIRRASRDAGQLCSLLIRTGCGSNLGCDIERGSYRDAFGDSTTDCIQDTFSGRWTCHSITSDTCTLNCIESE